MEEGKNTKRKKTIKLTEMHHSKSFSKNVEYIFYSTYMSSSSSPL